MFLVQIDERITELISTQILYVNRLYFKGYCEHMSISVLISMENK